MSSEKSTAKASSLKQAREDFLKNKQAAWATLWALALEVEVTKLKNPEFVNSEDWFFEENRFSVNCGEKSFRISLDTYTCERLTLETFRIAECALQNVLGMFKSWVEAEEAKRREAKRLLELRQAALGKLSPDEKKALGLSHLWVEAEEAKRREAKRLLELRQAALGKLSPDEKKELGLSHL